MTNASPILSTDGSAGSGFIEVINPRTNQRILVPTGSPAPVGSGGFVAGETLLANAIALIRRIKRAAAGDATGYAQQCRARGIVSGCNMGAASFLAPLGHELRGQLARALESAAVRGHDDSTGHLASALRDFPDALRPAAADASIAERQLRAMLHAVLLAHRWSAPHLDAHDRSSDHWLSLGRRAAFAEVASMWFAPDRPTQWVMHGETGKRIEQAVESGVDTPEGLLALVSQPPSWREPVRWD